MKRQKGGRLREREGRSLSSYARNGKAPHRYGDPGARLERIVHAEQPWRAPRGSKPFRTAPRSK